MDETGASQPADHRRGRHAVWVFLGDLRASWSYLMAWPEGQAQTLFQTGDGGKVWPHVPVQHVGDHRVIDARRIPRGAKTALAHRDPQVHGQGSRHLDDRVLRGHVGPAGAQIGRRGTAGAAHAFTIDSSTWINSQGIADAPGVTVGFYHRPTNVEPAIDRYVPVQAMKEWPRIREFVQAAVLDCAPQNTYSTRELLVVASQHVAWCVSTAGLPLERDVVFRREVISEFVSSTACDHTSEGTRGNYRSKLLRMSESLLSPQYRTVRLPALPPSNAAVPYCAADIAQLRSWASGQNTRYRRDNCRALLGLGMGAGLRAAEIAFVQAGHVTIDEEGVFVAVPGPRARFVPVLAEWEDMVADAAMAAADPAQFLFRADRQKTHRHLVANFVDKSVACEIPVSSQRMRATWLVTHMAAHVRVDALMMAAGVSSLEALTRYVQFLPPSDGSWHRRALRGRSRR